jgi:hypothetical protein
MATRNTKTRLVAAGASLALVAAVAGAGLVLPTDAAWAATSPVGVTQLQQETATPPVPKPGRNGEGRQRGPQAGNQQQRQQMHEAYQAALAGRLGVSADQLKEAQKQARIDLINQAVAEGKIDQARADRMIEAVQNGRGPGMGPGMGQGQGQGQGQRPGMGQRGQRPGGPGQQGQRPGGPGGPAGMAQGGPQVVADILGMTPQELRTEMQAGKTLAQVAEAKGVSRDELKAKLLEAHKTRIDAAVAAGKLTAEQAQQMTERATANIDQMLDRTPGQRPGPRGPRTGG